MSAACKYQPSGLSEGITIRCLKFGTGRGSNAITAALWTRSTLERALSLRLCSCPQEIYSLDQYVSHPTHASRSPGSHGSHSGGTGRPSRRKLTLHRQSPYSPGSVRPLLASKCFRRKSFRPISCSGAAVPSRPPVSQSVGMCFPSSDLSHMSPWYGSDVLRIAHTQKRVITLPTPHQEAVDLQYPIQFEGWSPLRGLRCQSAQLASARELANRPKIIWANYYSSRSGRLSIMLGLHSESSRTQ